MRKLFTLLTMCVLATAAWAVEITFDPAVDKGTFGGSAGAFSIEKEGVKLDIENGTVTDTQYRFYKGKNLTVSSLNGSSITQIVFECTAEGTAQYGPGCFTVNVGDYSYDGKIGTWTGAEGNIIFNAESNQVRATKVTVTVGDAGLASPSIKPAAGTYFGSVQVTITCSTQGAKIYYTTNGSDPTTSSTEYTGAFTLTSSATVKAISVLDGEVSGVTSVAYEILNPVNVANIAAYSGKEDGTPVKFTNSVYAIAQNGNYLYVKDNSGFGLFYGNTGQTYQLGSVIPAGFAGVKTTYAGEPELTTLNGFKAASGTVEINPETINATQVNHSMWAHYVYLENATIDPEAKILTDANGNTAPVYFSMGVTASQVTAGVPYKVWAIVGSYKPQNGDVVYQLLPIRVQRNDGQGNGIYTMNIVDDGTVMTMDYDATVLYQSGSYLYVKDQTGCGLIYGSVGHTYAQGNIIPAGYGGTKKTYAGEPELATPFTGFQNATQTVEVVPEEANPSVVSHEYFAHLIILRQVLIDANNNTLTDENGNSYPFYNNTFKVPMPKDLTKRYDVTGIVGSYGATNTVYQLLPTDWGIIPDTTLVRNIDELYALDAGDLARFTHPLTAIYQNNRDLYVKDVDGAYGFVYGDLGVEFNNGDFTNHPVVNWQPYNGIKEIIPVMDFTNDGHGDLVYPEEPGLIEDLSTDMVHWFVLLHNVTITPTDNELNYTLSDGSSETITLRNKYGLEIPVDGNTHDVWGFLTTYQDHLQIYAISIDVDPIKPPYKKGDVNGDGEVNIADINKLVSIILGAPDDTEGRSDVNGDGDVNIGDINVVIAIILKGE